MLWNIAIKQISSTSWKQVTPWCWRLTISGYWKYPSFLDSCWKLFSFKGLWQNRSMCCDRYLPNMFIKADTVKWSKVKPFFFWNRPYSWDPRFYSWLCWFSIEFTDLKICYCSFYESYITNGRLRIRVICKV